eukprot:1157004-Pelagomonas_calceolata.AAC.5
MSKAGACKGVGFTWAGRKDAGSGQKGTGMHAADVDVGSGLRLQVTETTVPQSKRHETDVGSGA